MPLTWICTSRVSGRDFQCHLLDPNSGGIPWNTENPYEHTHFVIYTSHFFHFSHFSIAGWWTIRGVATTDSFFFAFYIDSVIKTILFFSFFNVTELEIIEKGKILRKRNYFSRSIIYKNIIRFHSTSHFSETKGKGWRKERRGEEEHCAPTAFKQEAFSVFFLYAVFRNYWFD